MIERAFHGFNHAPDEPVAELVSVEETREKREIVSLQYLGLLAALHAKAQGIEIHGWQPVTKKDVVWLDHQLLGDVEHPAFDDISPAAA